MMGRKLFFIVTFCSFFLSACQVSYEVGEEVWINLSGKSYVSSYSATGTVVEVINDTVLVLINKKNSIPREYSDLKIKKGAISKIPYDLLLPVENGKLKYEQYKRSTKIIDAAYEALRKVILGRPNTNVSILIEAAKKSAIELDASAQSYVDILSVFDSVFVTNGKIKSGFDLLNSGKDFPLKWSEALKGNPISFQGNENNSYGYYDNNQIALTTMHFIYEVNSNAVSYLAYPSFSEKDINKELKIAVNLRASTLEFIPLSNKVFTDNGMLKFRGKTFDEFYNEQEKAVNIAYNQRIQKIAYHYSVLESNRVIGDGKIDLKVVNDVFSKNRKIVIDNVISGSTKYLRQYDFSTKKYIRDRPRKMIELLQGKADAVVEEALNNLKEIYLESVKNKKPISIEIMRQKAGIAYGVLMLHDYAKNKDIKFLDKFTYKVSYFLATVR